MICISVLLQGRACATSKVLSIAG